MLVFNHTGHVAMWNYVINTLSSITEETIRNTVPEKIPFIADEIIYWWDYVKV